MSIKQRLLRTSTLAAIIWSTNFGTIPVYAQDAATEAKEPAEEEPVETLKKVEKPETADAPQKPAAGKTVAPDKAEPASVKPKANLSEQLLEGLGLPGGAAGGNPLDSIVERMRDVQQRLQKTETDQQTRDQQTRIVKDLDDLIEKLKNQKPPPPSPNQNQPPPPPMGDPPPETPPRGGAQPRPQNSQKQRAGAEQQKSAEQLKQQQKQQESAAQPQSTAKSRESEDRLRQGRSAEEEAARQRMAKDVWGHLPAALRQELLNVYSEKFLPKYDDMVRKYYEALAEQNRQTP